MTKKTKGFLFLFSVTVVAIIAINVLLRKEQKAPKEAASPAVKPGIERPAPVTAKSVQRPPKQEQQKAIPQTAKAANIPSPEWKENLESTIRLQGGDAVKDVILNKVDSFVWSHEGISLFVESVIVTIKNHRNEETTFKVLVDAQNGKILRNFERPVFDPVNPKEGFKIRIDPRYHGD